VKAMKKFMTRQVDDGEMFAQPQREVLHGAPPFDFD
jgi:hypothetical protein